MVLTIQLSDDIDPTLTNKRLVLLPNPLRALVGGQNQDQIRIETQIDVIQHRVPARLVLDRNADVLVLQLPVDDLLDDSVELLQYQD